MIVILKDVSRSIKTKVLTTQWNIIYACLIVTDCILLFRYDINNIWRFICIYIYTEVYNKYLFAYKQSSLFTYLHLPTLERAFANGTASFDVI